MAERPILFSAPMVRAILNGSKTQTRRVVKLKPWHQIEERDDGTLWPWMYDSDRDGDHWLPCPYGQPGDKLWVREAHWWFRDERDPETGYYPPALTIEDVKYRADGNAARRAWRPSIHMPRWASRITLEVTGVRVERLQDISEADAVAEGIERVVVGEGWRRYDPSHAVEAAGLVPCETARASFRSLWQSINGPGSWEANPFCWVVQFRPEVRNA